MSFSATVPARVVPPARMLGPAEQNEWLVKHIPHRIRAVAAGIQMQPPWYVPIPKFEEKSDPAALHCVWAAIHEGRLAAIRWLIEFLGISEQNGTAVKAQLRGLHDVRIDSIAGGKLFPRGQPNAVKLAKIWKGCSQASSHATSGSCHPDVNDEKLAEALAVIIEHLERTIYAGSPVNLREKTFGLS